MSSHQFNSKNNGPVLLFNAIFRHWNCFLSSAARMARMDMDRNAMPARIFQKILFLVLPDKICWLSFSYLDRSFLRLGNLTEQRLQHRIDLKQQYPRSPVIYSILKFLGFFGRSSGYQDFSSLRDFWLGLFKIMQDPPPYQSMSSHLTLR